MGDKTLEMTMLLDFFGELLTEKQRGCFAMYYNEDLSLAEIAEIMAITRQGVRDLIVRAEATLTETEAKTGLLKRFTQQRTVMNNMAKELSKLEQLTEGAAKKLCQSLQNELESVRN